MTKLERLQKAVVDAEAAADAYDESAYADASYTAIVAWRTAKKKLAEYLKEQDND
tara:strand:+ start:1200 stop:1364 length:165 start_codon:yes stop_codon:yes gene_type:complete